MISLLQTDLALILVVPLGWIAGRSPWLSAFLAAPVAVLQFFPATDAAIGARSPLDAACAATRAVLLLGLPALGSWARRREREHAAALGVGILGDLRSAQLAEFLSWVLYQLREYLITVTSLVEALTLSAPKGDQAFTEKLSRLKRAVSELNAKAARLLGDRSALTTQSPREPAPFDLSALARRAAQDAQSAFGSSRISVSLTEEGCLRPVTADARAVRACVLAALQNSMQACAGKGGAVSMVARETADSAQLEIVDDGGGIAAPVLETIFEPIFSARARGLGLGLPMARRLMERMGGALRVKSKEGRTAVLLELPLGGGLPVIRNEESTWAGRRSQA